MLLLALEMKGASALTVPLVLDWLMQQLGVARTRRPRLLWAAPRAPVPRQAAHKLAAHKLAVAGFWGAALEVALWGAQLEVAVVQVVFLPARALAPP